MDSTSSARRTVAGRSQGEAAPAATTGLRPTQADGRAKSARRSRQMADFLTFADEVLRELDPRGALERLVAGHAVHWAWKLKGHLEKPEVRPADLDRASRSLGEALELLRNLRAGARPDPVGAPPERTDEPEAPADEWPVGSDGSDDRLAGGLDPDEDAEGPSWRDRLVYDFEVSEASPVVLGTWVTVGHVVSLIVDGWTWADILRSHPELTEDDIRTCVAYAVAEGDSFA